jgi:hypothetical protein
MRDPVEALGLLAFPCRQFAGTGFFGEFVHPFPVGWSKVQLKQRFSGRPGQVSAFGIHNSGPDRRVCIQW